MDYTNEFSSRILVAPEVAIRKFKYVFFTLSADFVVQFFRHLGKCNKLEWVVAICFTMVPFRLHISGLFWFIF